MTPDTQPASASKKMLWAGYVVSALPVLLFLMGGVMTFVNPKMVTDGMAKYGYPEGFGFKLGILELILAVIYAIPQTAVLGAILLTGYLGGATATHVRVGEPFFMPVIVGVVVWLGLFLRDARIRALIPLNLK